jgi:tetratricopeptide (TPR) repeat protein
VHTLTARSSSKEGDPSRAAYVIIDGKVELAISGSKSPTQLAVLEEGEILGEMGVLDGSPRSATAHAVGRVRVRIIPGEMLLDSLANEPEKAMAVMGKLAQRLRTTDEKLVRVSAEGEKMKANSKPGKENKSARKAKPSEPFIVGLVQKLFGKRRIKVSSRLQVVVAPFLGEGGLEQVKFIVSDLNKHKDFKAQPLNKPLGAEPALDPTDELMGNTAAARQHLVETDADLVIWGEIPEPGVTLHLRFVSTAEFFDDSPGTFGPATALIIPLESELDFSPLLLATAFAATTPRDKAKALRIRAALPPQLEAAQPLIGDLPKNMTSRERAAIHICFGNAVAVAASHGTPELYRVAADSFTTGLKLIQRTESPIAWVFARKNQGAVLQAHGERTNKTAVLTTAAEAFRDVLQAINKDLFPRDWAATQFRLGTVLYRIDLKSGETELLKEGLVAYQSALQVFNRTEFPLRWAEVMNSFAQAAQVLGRELGNLEVLEKAVDACRKALEIRTRDTMPALWAATQNNLGSALFQLGRLSEEREDLEGAEEAFSLARDYYKEKKASKMVALTERNLSHVERVLGRFAGRDIPKMHWEEAEEDSEAATDPEDAEVDAEAEPDANKEDAS